MTTYGTMQDRIASELARSDLTSHIQSAIKSAIKHHERERFYFNEKIGTFSLSSSQEYYSTTDYSDMDKITAIDSIVVTSGTTKYALDPLNFTDMDIISSGNTFGDPSHYTYYRQQLRFYPVPNQGRLVTISHPYKFAALSLTTDTNAWMTDGEELIRMRAKADIFENVIRNYERAQFFKARETEVLSALRGELAEIAGVGRIRPSI